MKKKVTVKMLAAYQNHLIAEERSSVTIEKYMRDVNKFYQFLPTDKRVDKASVIAFKKQLLETYQTSSVNSMLAAVNGFLTFIGREKYRVRQVKVQRRLFCREEKELTKEEYLRLLNAAEKNSRRLYMIIQTIASTGIRVSELPYITAASVQKGFADVSCKNKSRRIFIPAKLRSMLKKYVTANNIQSGPVFITRNKKAVSRSNIWKEMKQLSEKAGVASEKIFPHNLRHLFACTYYSKEKDLLKLADILGHSSIETTRIYTVTSGREHALHLDRMGLVISG